MSSRKSCMMCRGRRLAHANVAYTSSMNTGGSSRSRKWPPTTPPLMTDDDHSASVSFPDSFPNVVDEQLASDVSCANGGCGRSQRDLLPVVHHLLSTHPRNLEASTHRLHAKLSRRPATLVTPGAAADSRCSVSAFSAFDDAAPGGAGTATATTHSFSNSVQQQCSAAVTMFHSSNNAQRRSTAATMLSDNVQQQCTATATMFHNGNNVQQQCSTTVYNDNNNNRTVCDSLSTLLDFMSHCTYFPCCVF